MRDLDSAVGRLDNILMSVYVIVAILIIAIALVSFSFILPFPVLFSHQLLCLNLTPSNLIGSTIGYRSHRRWNTDTRS
jgi:hypothetical protein